MRKTDEDLLRRRQHHFRRCHIQLFPQKPDLILLSGGVSDICHAWEYRQVCAAMVSVVFNAREQEDLNQ